tara:strand:- start:2 stop:598 length:597 start_codon:yes stop_codon:yes gene_type:complete
MEGFPESIQSLVDHLLKFPGIGKKTAQRLALHILKTDKNEIDELAESLIEVKRKIKFCKNCNNFSELNICEICEDINRDSSIVCIVEQPTDILLFDKTGYSGKFYVLGSLISPLDGIGPDDISIKRLIDRIGEFNEVIIGLDTSAEGDATSLYLTDLLKGYNLKVTRLSRGIPIGGSFDYIDSATLARSINDRTSIET